MSILEVTGLKKIYTTRFGGNKVEALRNVSFSVEQGEYVAIMGESGSGKTTLLNILAALDKPTSGTVMLDGKDLSKLRNPAWRPFGGIIWGSCFRISTCWIPLRWRITSISPWCSRGNPTRKCSGD